MPTIPGTLQTVQEVETSTIGDATPTPASGSLTLFANQNGSWYAKNSAGAVSALAGVTSVTAANSSIVIAGTGSAPTVRLGNFPAYSVLANATSTSAQPTGTQTLTLGTPGFTIAAGSGAAQITGTTTSYLQASLQNTSSAAAASTDFIVSNNLGTDTTYYIDMGMNSSAFTGTGSLNLANAGYLYTQTGDLVIGTATSNTVRFLANNAATDALQILPSNLPATPGLTGYLYANGSNAWSSSNIWVDATAVGILTGNTGAANVTAFNTWYASASLGSTLFFPPGTYDFASELTLNRDIRIRFLGAGKGRSILRNTSATANLFNQTVAGFYISFEELGFSASATKTAGAAIIASGNNAYLDVRRCDFQGQFRAIDFSSAAGNVGVINECFVSAPTSGGSQFRINGTGINMMIQNTTINCGAVASVCCEITQVGACQIVGCDFIGGTNALLINPSTGQVEASTFVTNTYFDNTLGSCVKITGAGASQRNQFICCSMTLAAAASAGSAAIECSSTVTAGAQGLQIISCNILNTFGAASCNGVLMTGAADYIIEGCNIAGWTTGLNLTPNPSAGTTIAKITGNIIGTSGGYGVNTTGILLNAGAAAYGALEILSNDVSGNTTPFTNNLTANVPATASRYRIADNAGINPRGAVTQPAVPASNVAVTNTTGIRCSVYLRAGTITAITVNGVSTGVTASPSATGTLAAVLDPGGTIAITYTVAPTWVWIGN